MKGWIALSAMLLLVSASKVYADYFVDFEDAVQPSYATNQVELNGLLWEMTNTIIGSRAEDKKNGERAARLRQFNGVPGKMVMLEDKTGGLGTISFLYARFGSDTNQPNLTVQYSNDQGSTWTDIATISHFPDNLTEFSSEIRVWGNIRVRFVTDLSGEEDRRINIDDLLLTDYGVTEIIQTPKAYITTEMSVAVSAKIRVDENIIESVRLRWGILPETYPNEISMFQQEGELYTVQSPIPEQEAETAVYYIIEADIFEQDAVSYYEQNYYVREPGYFTDFEDGEKRLFATGSVVLNNLEWEMTEVIIDSHDNNMKFGEQSARFRQRNDRPTEMVMLEDKENGIGRISFWYSRANFLYDKSPVAPSFVVEYSKDSGMNWTRIGETIDLHGVDELTLFSETVNDSGNIRVRFRSISGDNNRNFNIDDLHITDFYEDVPLNVILSSFTASMLPKGSVKVSWVTESENNMSGYNVFRNIHFNLCDAVRMTPHIIPAHNCSQTRDYSFIDNDIEQNHTYYYWLQANNLDLTSQFYGPVSVFTGNGLPEEDPAVAPPKTELLNAYPNPFNTQTQITFSLAESAYVELTVHNMIGQIVRKLISGKFYDAGRYEVLWDGRNDSGHEVASGIFFYRLETDRGEVFGRKMLLLK